MRRRLIIAGLALLPAALALSLQGVRVAEVQVAPAAPTLSVGANQKLHATAYDSAGNVIVTRVRYRWVSANVNIARVDSTGQVSGVAAGSAVVRAEVVGAAPAKSGAATVTVRR